MRNEVNKKLIKVLKDYGVSSAFIADIFYHKTTLDFLNSINVFTIGIVPVTSDSKNVRLVIPTSSNSLFLQFFTLKFILYINKHAEEVKYTKTLKTWVNYFNGKL